MTDIDILDLYFERNQRALTCTAEKYGGSLLRLASNMVSREDAEECTNDTYLSAWNSIPPARPENFFAWLSRVCRNHAISRMRWEQAQKRSAEVVEFSQEMAECIPDEKRSLEVEDEELGRVISDFLRTLPKEKRVLFIRRYWYGDPIHRIAEEYGYSESKVKTTIHRIRFQLREYLREHEIRL